MTLFHPLSTDQFQPQHGPSCWCKECDATRVDLEAKEWAKKVEGPVVFQTKIRNNNQRSSSNAMDSR